MSKFEIWMNGEVYGYTTGISVKSVEMRLRRFGWKTSQMDIIEVM